MFFFIFFRKKYKSYYFDFRFRWPLPNIRFWLNIRLNIRSKASAKTTFGRTLTSSACGVLMVTVGCMWHAIGSHGVLNLWWT
jgi:hypothetical protein